MAMLDPFQEKLADIWARERQEVGTKDSEKIEVKNATNVAWDGFSFSSVFLDLQSHLTDLL